MRLSGFKLFAITFLAAVLSAPAWGANQALPGTLNYVEGKPPSAIRRSTHGAIGGSHVGEMNGGGSHGGGFHGEGGGFHR